MEVKYSDFNLFQCDPHTVLVERLYPILVIMGGVQL